MALVEGWRTLADVELETVRIDVHTRLKLARPRCVAFPLRRGGVRAMAIVCILQPLVDARGRPRTRAPHLGEVATVVIGGLLTATTLTLGTLPSLYARLATERSDSSPSSGASENA